ncbi:hypothetical protein PUN28_014639 [Cardiocondyla obscurior]|uniref:MADF domain-containing protein n=1 Tax=Cardiocondyla obscurior TaxID=286306 RepID=A0AAW2F5D5_9HYME
MDNEKLIELIKEYVMLYDLSHPKYLDGQYKDKVWKVISEELDQPVNVCKNKWNNIRDNFRKSLKKKKKKKKSGPSAVKIHKYKYSDQLGFLTNFSKERDTFSSVQHSMEDNYINIETIEEENLNEESDTEPKEIEKQDFIKRKVRQNKQEKSKENATSTLKQYIHI